FLRLRHSPISAFLPYTTLFRSSDRRAGCGAARRAAAFSSSARWSRPRARPRRRGSPPWRRAIPSALPPETRFRRSSSDLQKRDRSEEHTSELQSRENLVCRLLL